MLTLQKNIATSGRAPEGALADPLAFMRLPWALERPLRSLSQRMLTRIGATGPRRSVGTVEVCVRRAHDFVRRSEAAAARQVLQAAALGLQAENQCNTEPARALRCRG
jgi:hypothetical protein